jgi:hypothetical protein
MAAFSLAPEADYLVEIALGALKVKRALARSEAKGPLPALSMLPAGFQVVHLLD